MIKYNYKAYYTQSNELVFGHMLANSEHEVIGYLHTSNLTVQEVKPAMTPIAKLLQFPIDIEEKSNLCHSLGSLMEGGIPILSALTSVAEITDNKKVADALVAISQQVNGGSSLYEAVKSHPMVFDDILCGMIKIGELSGTLDLCLIAQADAYDRQMENDKKLGEAIASFKTTMILTLASVVVTAIWVMPVFEDLFTKLKIDLPMPTIIMIAISNFMIEHPFLAGLIAPVMFGLTKWYKAKNAVKYDNFILKLPVFGAMRKKLEMERLTTSISILAGSGIQFDMALEAASKSSSNEWIVERLLEMANTVKTGVDIATAAKASNLFNAMTLQFTNGAAQTGEVSGAFRKMSQFYKRGVDRDLTKLTDRMKPLLMVIAGGIVTFIAAATYLPQLDMLVKFSGG